MKENSKTSWIDIGARFRLWSRNTDCNKPALAEFLKSKGFKEGFIYDNETNTQSTAYLGLEMTKLEQFKISKNPTQVEQFLFDKCIRHVTGRLTCKDLGEAFTAWKNEKNPNYTKYDNKDKKELNQYLNKEFLAATVHDGTRIRFGFYGLCLKGKETVGKKTKTNNRKKVEQVDPNTDEVIATFDSITHAAKEISVSISAISVAISANKVCKNYKFRSTTV